MAAYLTGAGASFVFVMLFTIAAGLVSHWQPYFKVLPAVWTYAIAINYLGCILGWILLRTVGDKVRTGRKVVLFALLGYLFGVLLAKAFLGRWMLGSPFIWLTVPGSLVYLWGHAGLEKGPMRRLFAYGPIAVLVVCLAVASW